jgi:KaiC/GvpD/RAD55 family RecA-like ATPase
MVVCPSEAHAHLRRRGSGKTMLAIEFLLRGATESGEPGIFMRNDIEE